MTKHQLQMLAFKMCQITQEPNNKLFLLFEFCICTIILQYHNHIIYKFLANNL